MAFLQAMILITAGFIRKSREKYAENKNVYNVELIWLIDMPQIMVSLQRHTRCGIK
jgi:hypothetical protein